MGANSGIVLNESPYHIQYVVYGNYREKGDQKSAHQINPNIEIGSDKVSLSGFKVTNQSEIKNKYGNSFVMVPPGRCALSGLQDIKMGKHKISVKVVVKQYEKFLLSDVVIRQLSDMRLKIRADLSVKNMGDKEAETLIQKNAQATNAPMGPSYQQPEVNLQAQQKLYQKIKQNYPATKE